MGETRKPAGYALVRPNGEVVRVFRERPDAEAIRASCVYGVRVEPLYLESPVAAPPSRGTAETETSNG
jgi:hypothetical protein